MNVLRNGIVVFDSHPISDRVSISDGILHIREDDNSYFQPIKHFRHPTLDEENTLYTYNPESVSYLNKISITKLPEFLFEPLIEIGLSTISNEYDLLKLKSHPLYVEMISSINKVVNLYKIKNINFQQIGLTCNMPNLLTTTRLANTNLPLGLHLDYWDNLTKNSLKYSRNRICINLSYESRYLLFINLSIIEIDKILKENNIYSADSREARINFLKYFPSYKVVKIKIQPFEAYIAPTELLIHDGCTINNKHVDLTLTYLGHFDITKKSIAFYLECKDLLQGQ